MNAYLLGQLKELLLTHANTELEDDMSKSPVFNSYPSSDASYYGWPNHAVEPMPPMKHVTRGKDIPVLLWDLLTHATPHPHEEPVRNIILQFLRKQGYSPAVDGIGNVILDVPKSDGSKARAMFSCHMDTVHHKAGKISLFLTTGEDTKAGYIYGSINAEGGVTFVETASGREHLPQDLSKLAHKYGCESYRMVKQQGSEDTFEMEMFFRESDPDAAFSLMLTKARKDGSYVPSVLGADDKAGCYVMLRMAENRVPGLYVFHVGEECGAHGSNHIVTKTPELVQGRTMCVAFDRKGYSDVIWRQGGGDTASETFAQELSEQLNRMMPANSRFAPSSHGIFTDSQVYSGLISECTNLAVGYFNQHQTRENLDLVWLQQLFIPAVLQVDWESLGAHRDPNATRTKTHWWDHYDEFMERGPARTPYPSTNLVRSSFTKTSNAEPASDKIPFTQRNVNKIPVEKINRLSRLSDIPVWFPEDGYIVGASTEAMEMMVWKYLVDAKSSWQTAKFITSLLEDLRDADIQIDELENEIEKYEILTGMVGAA